MFLKKNILLLLCIFFKLNYCNQTFNEINQNIYDNNENNTIISPIIKFNNKNNAKKNIILGIIENYNWDIVSPFFESIIKVNFTNCDIVMFVRNVSEKLKNKLKNISIIIYKIPEKYKNIPAINCRWKMYIEFLKNKQNEYNIVFSTDVRDVIFQKDVFQYYKNHEPFLGVALEEDTLKEVINKKWVKDFCGKKKYEKIKNERIICVGTIWGTFDKFLNFSIIFYEKLSLYPNNIEQGIANYLFYYEGLFKDCLIKSDNFGPVMTLRLVRNEIIKFDSQYNILNFRGEIAAVIHQYDRKFDVTKKVKIKFCPDLLIKEENKTFGELRNIITFFIYLESLTIVFLLKIALYLCKIKRK